MSFPELTTTDAQFGPVHAIADLFSVTLTASAGDLEQTVNVAFGQLDDLVEAFDRHDGLLLSPLTYTEAADGAVTLEWFDYDIEESPVGGQVIIPSEQVAPLVEWLRDLPRPPLRDDVTVNHPSHGQVTLAQLHEIEADRRRRVREQLYAGLPDSITATVADDPATYRLWARDDHGNGLYGLPHADPDDELRWMLRAPDGQLSATGRPQAPDRHGRPRRWLAPRRSPAGDQWIWVRVRP